VVEQHRLLRQGGLVAQLAELRAQLLAGGVVGARAVEDVPGQRRDTAPGELVGPGPDLLADAGDHRQEQHAGR
jgi:hypothetical protein